jgi:hypothetical protein
MVILGGAQNALDDAACPYFPALLELIRAFEANRPLVRAWSETFAHLIAERHPDWPNRLDGELEMHGPQADAVGLSIARAWTSVV